MEANKLVQAFESELNLTEQGLLELSEQKKGLVIDVKTDAGFKLARKERTEQNKIIKNIDDLAISGKKSVDEARNVLKTRVANIYAPIVTAFEAENIRRKEEEARIAKIEEERIQSIRNEINAIRNFSQSTSNKTAAEIQDIIEAVDMIDVSINFEELTQEALAVKKETLSELTNALARSIQEEQLAQEREALRKEQEEVQEQARINELKARAQVRLNNLVMIPSSFFGKSSSEINVKINSLKQYEVQEEEFGELFNQANVVKGQVINQLSTMAEQQTSIEKFDAEQAAIRKAEQEKAQDEANAIALACAQQSKAVREEATLNNKEVAPQTISEAAQLAVQLGEQHNIYKTIGEYEPLALWPSDIDLAENEQLAIVCQKLQEAEDYIALLLGDKAA